MKDIRNVLCAKDKVPLQSPEDTKLADRLSCPICGAGGTKDEVLQEVAKYVEEETAIYLQKQARQMASRHKFMSFENDFVPAGNHRFIVDLDFG